jgi:hypothetical protein
MDFVHGVSDIDRNRSSDSDSEKSSFGFTKDNELVFKSSDAYESYIFSIKHENSCCKKKCHLLVKDDNIRMRISVIEIPRKGVVLHYNKMTYIG